MRILNLNPSNVFQIWRLFVLFSMRINHVTLMNQTENNYFVAPVVIGAFYKGLDKGLLIFITGGC